MPTATAPPPSRTIATTAAPMTVTTTVMMVGPALTKGVRATITPSGL